jgi:hypothetical protein
MQNTLTRLVASAAIAALMLSSVEAQPPKNQAARASTAQPKLPPINPSRLIGNVLYIEAPGCESRAQHFDVGIPDAGRLNTAHQGIVPGIEFVPAAVRDRLTDHLHDALQKELLPPDPGGRGLLLRSPSS